MRKKPVALLISSLLFLYFPIAMVLGWTRGEPVTLVDVIFSGALPLVLIFGLLRVTKTGWYTLIALIALWGIRDLYDYYGTDAESQSTLFIHIVIYFASLTYFINPRVRHLYFDPKTRWWRTKPRFETYMPFIVKHGEVWNYPIMRNISEGGCFLETSHQMKVGDRIHVSMPLPIPLGVSVFKAEGEIRWVSSNPLRHGMGVQFNDLPVEHSRALHEYVRLQL